MHYHCDYTRVKKRDEDEMHSFLRDNSYSFTLPHSNILLSCTLLRLQFSSSSHWFWGSVLVVWTWNTIWLILFRSILNNLMLANRDLSTFAYLKLQAKFFWYTLPEVCCSNLLTDCMGWKRICLGIEIIILYAWETSSYMPKATQNV